MRLGTKSVLFGVHCFLVHPWFVALAWWKLYGFPWDPRLWFCFFVHDLGYIGKPNMDGPEGEWHPVTGALLARWFLDGRILEAIADIEDEITWGKVGGASRAYWYPKSVLPIRSGYWHDFTLLHSRYFAKAVEKQFSRLCVADKYSVCVTPWWLYKLQANLSGEIREYMANAKRRAADNDAVSPAERRRLQSDSQRDWFNGLRSYMRRWVMEHKDGREDRWTRRAA